MNITVSCIIKLAATYNTHMFPSCLERIVGFKSKISLKGFSPAFFLQQGILKRGFEILKSKLSVARKFEEKVTKFEKTLKTSIKSILKTQRTYINGLAKSKYIYI